MPTLFDKLFTMFVVLFPVLMKASLDKQQTILVCWVCFGLAIYLVNAFVPKTFFEWELVSKHLYVPKTSPTNSLYRKNFERKVLIFS